MKGPNIRYEKTENGTLFTPLNQDGDDVLRRALELKAPHELSGDYEWQGNAVLVTNMYLLDQLEIFLAVASRLDEYIDGKPRWALKGGESLEDAYERFLNGEFSQEEAHESATNDCECGGIGRCWSEIHDAMREALSKA